MRKSSNNKPSMVSGMTMIELLMTMSIAVVVVALLASGNFRDFIDDAWMWLTKSNIQGNFQLAKSEAVTRNTKVRICAKEPASESCSGAGDNGWKEGFIMFTDVDDNDQYDNATEELIRVGDAMPDGQQITAPSHTFVFSPDGTVEGIAATVAEGDGEGGGALGD